MLSIDDALAAAEDARQDLVEVSPQASPPVCRLQDYNKAVYAAKLREKVGHVTCTQVPLAPQRGIAYSNGP